MKARMRWIALLALLLLVASVSSGCLFSNSYQIPNSSARGGNTGGQVSTSASYTLVTGFGGMVQVNQASANYSTCNGFVCTTNGPFSSVYMPVIQKN